MGSLVNPLSRPGRCPSTGPASRASGPAPTWRRRSGRADGGGAQTGPSRAGGQGEGVGEGETLSRLPPLPRGVRKREREGLQESPGCAPHDDAYVEGSSPRKRPSFPHSPSGSWDSNTG